MINAENKRLRINVRLFKKVQRAILREGKAFKMSWWVDVPVGSTVKSKEHPCFTSACMAGWVVFKDKGRLPRVREVWFDASGTKHSDVLINTQALPSRARKALGITENQGRYLFFKENWPRGLGRGTEAERASRLIDKFLELKGDVGEVAGLWNW